MAERMMVWLGAGLLAAGLSAATITGAATATADDDPGAITTSAQSTEPADSGEAPDADKPGAREDSVGGADGGTDIEEGDEPEEPADDGAGDATDIEEGDEPEEPADEGEGDSPEEVAEEVETVDGEIGSGLDHDGVTEAEEPETADASATDVQTPVVDDGFQVPEDIEPSQTDSAAKSDLVSEASAYGAATASAAQSSQTSARLLTTSAPQEARTILPSPINVIGSFFWGLFDLVVKLVDFPPAVPPGSTVTAGRSRLEIDCGDGYTTDADWYFPTEGEPDKFIYFQHGFPARAGFYNLTLAELAERNNAIVVAPNITANIFACDACALSGEPMQAAVARLFEGDRAALAASAIAAGFSGTLPEQFVLTGQSAGAPLAIAAASNYYRFASDSDKSDMAGVILYDVSNTGGAKRGSALSNALDTLPASIPVLNIMAEPAPVNLFGDANPALAEKRPGQFNGIQLVGGAHADAFRSSTLLGIPQFLVSLVFGASKPENVEAVHVLTQGWLTDMYAGRVYNPTTRTGIYGTPGAPGEVVIDIPTDAGLAHGYVLPAAIRVLSPIDTFIATLLGLINVNYFAICVTDTNESASAQSNLSCPV